MVTDAIRSFKIDKCLVISILLVQLSLYCAEMWPKTLFISLIVFIDF